MRLHSCPKFWARSLLKIWYLSSLALKWPSLVYHDKELLMKPYCKRDVWCYFKYPASIPIVCLPLIIFTGYWGYRGY